MGRATRHPLDQRRLDRRTRPARSARRRGRALAARGIARESRHRSAGAPLHCDGARGRQVRRGAGGRPRGLGESRALAASRARWCAHACRLERARHAAVGTGRACRARTRRRVRAARGAAQVRQSRRRLRRRLHRWGRGVSAGTLRRLDRRAVARLNARVGHRAGPLARGTHRRIARRGAVGEASRRAPLRGAGRGAQRSAAPSTLWRAPSHRAAAASRGSGGARGGGRAGVREFRLLR